MLRVKKRDTLYLVEGPEGLTLTPYRQDFGEQMEAVRKVMKCYRNALRELAAFHDHGLARNHPFIDTLTAAAVFLEINGYSLDAPESEAVMAITE